MIQAQETRFAAVGDTMVSQSDVVLVELAKGAIMQLMLNSADDTRPWRPVRSCVSLKTTKTWKMRCKRR